MRKADILTELLAIKLYELSVSDELEPNKWHQIGLVERDAWRNAVKSNGSTEELEIFIEP